MFDDDTSSLDEAAAILKAKGFTLFYPYDRAVLAVLRDPLQDAVLLIRKTRNLPFYQFFFIGFKPTNANYLKLVQTNSLISYVFANPSLVTIFDPGDVSGHDNFIGELTKSLEELFA